MKELIDKLSSYNIFNYLFPGIIFVVIANKTTSYNLIQTDIVVGVFLYYFIGLVISRIGSIIVEPILKHIGFVKFSEYKNYVEASRTDTKIEILSEANNMYRTICTIFLMVFSIKGVEWLTMMFTNIKEYDKIVLLIFLFLLFLFSYRKQTNYINKRIDVFGSKSPPTE